MTLIMSQQTMNCGRGRWPSNRSISYVLNSGPCTSLSTSASIASQFGQGVLLSVYYVGPCWRCSNQRS
ncbi:hypothetical protein RSAG8_04471, partial [Rhizoctonia solani AG-8 WAC10335]